MHTDEFHAIIWKCGNSHTTSKLLFIHMYTHTYVRMYVSLSMFIYMYVYIWA